MILNDIMNDLISVFGEVVNEATLKETEETDFVAVMLDGTSDEKQITITNSSEICAKGENHVKEQFIGFNEDGAD